MSGMHGCTQEYSAILEIASRMARFNKNELTCLFLPESLGSHFSRFLSTCKNMIIAIFFYGKLQFPSMLTTWLQKHEL